MLSPSGKGWISKYFDLIDKGEIWVSIRNYEELGDIKHLHLTFSRTGIVFGIPTRAIFGHKLKTTRWTLEEKLKVLLFEAHLFTYLKAGGILEKKAFVKTLSSFYGKHNANSISQMFKFLISENSELHLEKVLAQRVDIKKNYFENKWWANSLHNVFVYLDVILFHDYLANDSQEVIHKYSEFAQNALIAITLSAYADGKIDGIERDMFSHFLASANLNEEQRDVAIEKFKRGATFDDIDDFVHNHWLLKRFLYDVAILTAYSSLSADRAEEQFLEEFREFLDIPSVETEETIMFVENFIIENRNQTDFLTDAPSYEKVLNNFTERWRKILLRNKDKLAAEVRESKELVALIKKSMSTELTPEEKEKVKEQLKDILKSMPAFAVFMIPGGTILLPMMLKILPDLLPSSFQDNKIEK